MKDAHSAFPYIADLIEAPKPRNTLSALAKDLADITRMAAKARALLRSDGLGQADAHGIFLRLSDRIPFEEYALTTLNLLLKQPNLAAPLALKAKALKRRTERVDADLQQTLLEYYLHISKRLSDVTPVEARRPISLADLSKHLQNASLDLSGLLHQVGFVASLDQLPFTMKDIEKARADLRHNRSEIALAAAQLGTFKRTASTDSEAHHIAAEAAISTIARIIDALEMAYKDMEHRITRMRDHPATVH